jgi:diacylglycerol kinase family enzyme
VTAFAVFNPTANHGRTGRAWPTMEAALKTIFPGLVAMPSGGRGQTARLVRDALRDGHMEIVAVGGDGTINEAVNGFFEHGAHVSPDAVLSVVPAGSHGDIGFGLQTGVAAALRLRQARVRTVDLGHVACIAPGGGAAARFFLNAASFGLTGDIARRLNRTRLLPSRAIQEMLARAQWRACPVRLMADGGHDEIDGITAVGVANGQRFGGGLLAAPQADAADGLFDVAVLAGASRPQTGRMLRQLQSGAAVAELRLLHTTRLTAAPIKETSHPVWVETDGEAVGILPASFEIAPRVLRLRF